MIQQISEHKKRIMAQGLYRETGTGLVCAAEKYACKKGINKRKTLTHRHKCRSNLQVKTKQIG